MNDEQGSGIPDPIRVNDLLEQIAKVNKMIELHAGGDWLSEKQYRDIKSRFVNELREILRRYDVFVVDEPPVAA